MASSTPYDHDARAMDDDLIDPDDDILDDLDDPLTSRRSDRSPLTGNIQSQSSRNPIPQSYLTSTIGGEDRRAPLNTLDESVWATLSRDLTAVWEKMRLVLWPNNLLGGMLRRNNGGADGAAESGEADRLTGISGVRDLMGRLQDPDTVLQGNMSEGLRDWDLWGPLLFCLLLSMLLSVNTEGKQRAEAFSGMFAIIWIGEAIVTFQIKLLGGNISFFQSVCIIGYTLFPLVIASIFSAFKLRYPIRVPIDIVLIIWSLAAGISILGGSGVLKNRVGLAVYPLFVFYVGLGCLCIIA